MHVIRIFGESSPSDAHTHDAIYTRRNRALEISSRPQPHAAGANDLATVSIVCRVVPFVIYRRIAERPEERRNVALLGRILDEDICRQPI
jgi:hypothetical protein